MERTTNLSHPTVSSAPSVAALHTTLSAYGRELWDTCRPISGLARDYLEARRCLVPPSDGDLRWRPSVTHAQSGTSPPALVALVTDALTAVPLSLHFTWIQADGSKAPVDPARRLLKGHRKAGGVIRLWPDEAVTEGLAVAEGIETALSAAHAFTPVWSCIDAGNLGKLPVLTGIDVLTIAADNDDAGNSAARRCAQRWTRASAQVRIVKPPIDGMDMNDLVMRGAA